MNILRVWNTLQTLSMLQIPDHNGNPGQEAEWSIAIEQFLATTLTGQPIVDFFSTKIDLKASLQNLRKSRFLFVQNTGEIL